MYKTIFIIIVIYLLIGFGWFLILFYNGIRWPNATAFYFRTLHDMYIFIVRYIYFLLNGIAALIFLLLSFKFLNAGLNFYLLVIGCDLVGLGIVGIHQIQTTAKEFREEMILALLKYYGYTKEQIKDMSIVVIMLKFILFVRKIPKEEFLKDIIKRDN